ncbi:hypothetical protein [Kosakonia sacchari]
MKAKKAKKKVAVWWEKTVEYKFICDCVSSRIFNTICPLDGNEEILGDTITSIDIKDAFDKNDKMFIIEFKKTFENKCLKQETDKFTPKENSAGYLKAKKCFEKSELKEVKNSHFLIAAKYLNDDLELILRDYFSFKQEENKSLNECFAASNGMNLNTFISYASCFASHKKYSFCNNCGSGGGNEKSTNPEPSGPNGGEIKEKSKEPVNTTYVVGINPESKKCKIIPFELLKLLGPDNDSGAPHSPISNNSGSGVKIIIDENSEANAKLMEMNNQEADLA